MISKRPQKQSDPISDPYWDEVRNHDHSESFPAIRNFIDQNSPIMMRSNKRKKRSILILAVLLPVLIFFSCQRKTFTEPQGATLTFAVKDSLSPAVELAIQQSATREWKAVFKPKAGKMLGTVYTPVEQYEKLKAFAEKLKAMPGVTELYISAFRTTVKESAISRLSYHIFNLHLDAIDANDEQLHREIAAKLKEAGQENLQLQLVKENGKKQVVLVPTDKTRDFSLDFTLHDGTTVTAIAERW